MSITADEKKNVENFLLNLGVSSSVFSPPPSSPHCSPSRVLSSAPIPSPTPLSSPAAFSNYSSPSLSQPLLTAATSNISVSSPIPKTLPVRSNAYPPTGRRTAQDANKRQRTGSVVEDEEENVGVVVEEEMPTAEDDTGKHQVL